MRRRRLNWTASATADLEGILQFVSAESADGAQSVLAAVLASVGSLPEFPERGRVTPELERVDVREVQAFRYRIIYRVTTEEVIVLAIVHGARSLSDDDIGRSIRAPERHGRGEAT